MNLYNISEESVSAIIDQRLQDPGSGDGKYEVVENAFSEDHDYPIKVIFSKEKELVIVITAYPLKRGVEK